MSKAWHISTDKTLLNIEFIHSYISERSYWGTGQTIAQTQESIANSLCFGLYINSNEQIGFGRVVTDYVFFGYLMDVIIDEKHQGKGFGKIVINHILEHEKIIRLKTVALKTKDAHVFYEKHGFSPIGESELWMAIDKQKLN